MQRKSSLLLLAEAGEAAFGEDWQRPMARALAPHSPIGTLSDRHVRRWVAGDRPVPAWVPAALPAVLEEQADEHTRLAVELRRVAGDIINGFPGRT